MSKLEKTREALEFFSKKKYTKNHYNGVYCETVDDLETPKKAVEALEELNKFLEEYDVTQV